MITIEYVLLIGSLLVLVSIAMARFSENLGVPALLLFLGVGLLAGPEGVGGMAIADPEHAVALGVIALMLILFAGGLDTKWSAVKAVLWQGIGLSTGGVLLTAIGVGLFVPLVTPLSVKEGLLLGAIVSSTDAAAVLAVLRSKRASLKGNLKPLLEFESGSNDPMAVFLTLGFIQVLQSPEGSVFRLLPDFLLQMGIGAAAGFLLGRGIVTVLNRLKLAYEGLYPVFALASVGFGFSLAAIFGGSGFLAVYIAGIIVGNSDIVQKRSLVRFFDGLAWLGQITMFLALGLLVFPSRILPLLGAGVLLSAFLMLVARPLSVFVSLAPATSFHWREKSFVSWVGLRGAVPVILAIFPLVAGLPNAHLIFDLVFFIVVSSALLQGWSLPAAARVLGVEGPPADGRRSPLEFAGRQPKDSELVDFIIPYNCETAGKSIVELGLPKDCLIVLITRDTEFIVPSGGTTLQAGDALLVLVNTRSLPDVRRIFSRRKT